MDPRSMTSRVLRHLETYKCGYKLGTSFSILLQQRSFKRQLPDRFSHVIYEKFKLHQGIRTWHEQRPCWKSHLIKQSRQPHQRRQAHRAPRLVSSPGQDSSENGGPQTPIYVARTGTSILRQKSSASSPGSGSFRTHRHQPQPKPLTAQPKWTTLLLQHTPSPTHVSQLKETGQMSPSTSSPGMAFPYTLSE
jgi:hypothetical protein